MACPNCGCKVHYQFNDADFGPDDERLERCAACGAVFDIEDSTDEEEDELSPSAISPPTPSPQTCTHAPARSHLCEHDCAEGAVGGPRCEGPCAVLGLHPMDEVAHGVGEVQPQQFWCDKQGHGGRRCRRFCGLDICEPATDGVDVSGEGKR